MEEYDKKRIEWIKFGIDNFKAIRVNIDQDFKELETSSFFRQGYPIQRPKYPTYIIILSTHDELTFTPHSDQSNNEIRNILNNIKFIYL